ncbi:type I phosphodiesterase/nucleotide pyrophosphatase [Desulforamulus reducens MI-1]|uniref:Type I phosphodiesterase/nucleotide pyrophosphatase n=1 Tax=Desulforamulus reducens (strain ATCC BAA-1160 / DSM 100696 / MI-1) TaxID=349161 RepID=A4J564_DESRM|nr:alkaline phosphatase family protein [Desulforamulus reducens]ABO50217.1 type I phosphodiesterase/nucleotide pyrophosphatase [Desulforamulus reducens MI-1]
MPENRKKVIYLVVDSFHPRALEHCMAQGKLPTLSYLIQKGSLHKACISAFPTATPTCTSTLATGVSPTEHRIPGMVWYHRGERRIVDYGSTWLSFIKNGIIQTVQDFVYNLNHKQLGWQIQTIYENLESKGYYTAAVNPLIYRGNKEYIAHIPFILKLITLFQLEDMTIYGPKGLSLGRTHQPPGDLRQSIKEFRYWRKFGINDKFAVKATQWFLGQQNSPDLLSVYLPDTDSIAHAKDPDCCEPCLTRLDKHLGSILNCFGNWDKALAERVFIIVGDHAQSALIPGKKALANVPEILGLYSQLRAGEDFTHDKDIVICSNERMAYIYLLRYQRGMKENIVACLLKEKKIDQIVWKADGWYHVATDRGKLSFSMGTGHHDCYGNQWQVKGEKGALDLKLDGESIQYGDYPNALERIAQCLDNPHAGDFAVTAKPGFIIHGEGAPRWPGRGSHGSLYREDSLVPLIISGAPAKMEKPRLMDIVSFLKSLFL